MTMVGILPTTVPGERAYTWHALFDRIFYGEREAARSFSGTSSFLNAIGAGVYMALLGPSGMAELGRSNMQKAAYAAARIGALKGVKAPVLGSNMAAVSKESEAFSPPAMRTRPSASRVAAWSSQKVVITPDAVNLPVAGSYSSPEARYPVL